MPLYARILKSEINNFIKEAEKAFIEEFKNSSELKSKMNKILFSKLEKYLDDKSQDWDFQYESDDGFPLIINGPDSEKILLDFVDNIINKDFINSNFEVNLDDKDVDELKSYIYDDFDKLYDTIEDKIEEERENHKDNEYDDNYPYGPGMNQKDFL